ncbi:MAG: class I SAM-dependent methyltransferase [Verrucomicrobiia bacterium]
MNNPQLIPTRCAVCGTADAAREVYPANFSLEDLNPAVFSARRMPDRIHYRMVRCLNCGLLRSDPVANEETLASLYSKSTLDYSDEIPNLRLTYGRFLSRLLTYVSKPAALLEIGCGNGFALDEALLRGFSKVRGVEPSRTAVAAAPAAIGSNIVCDMMRPGLFGEGEFDAVCMFQVLDHIPEPGPLLAECFRVLKPGGVMLCINHNSKALSARVLGEFSPIVDIEHAYLYSPSTMRQLFLKHGFRILAGGFMLNTISMAHLIHLFPLPRGLKTWLLEGVLEKTFRRWCIRLPLGNLFQIAQRP